VHHTFFNEGRVRVSGRTRRLQATALVDGDVYNDSAIRHGSQHFAVDQLRSGSTRHKDRTNRQVGFLDRSFDGIDRRIQRLEPGTAEHIVQLCDAGQAAFQDRDLGTHTDGDTRGIHARYTATDHEDLCRRNTRDAPHQDTASTLSLFEAVSPGLRRHATGNLAHGRQERQTAMRAGYGFIGNCCAAGIYQTIRLRAIRSQVQIREKDLILAQHLALDGLRFFNLNNHIGGVEDALRIRSDLRSCFTIIVVGHANTVTCASLDQHGMAVMDQLANGEGNKPDPVLVIFDLCGHTYQHCINPAIFLDVSL